VRNGVDLTVYLFEQTFCIVYIVFFFTVTLYQINLHMFIKVHWYEKCKYVHESKQDGKIHKDHNTKNWGHAERSWLRHYAASRNVAGSNPVEVIGFFNWANYSSRSVVSDSNRNEYQESSWGVKDCRCIRLTTLPPSVSHLSRKCGSLDVSQSYESSRPVKGIALPFLNATYNVRVLTKNPKYRMVQKMLRN
jgi:hypothetical protein